METTTEQDDQSDTINAFNNIESDESEVDNEIEILQNRVKQLQERGERIRDAIVEQTKLLLSEESLLSGMRIRLLLNQLQRRPKQRQQKTRVRNKKQRELFRNILGLEKLLEHLDRAEGTNKIQNIELKEVESDGVANTDIILNHPTIAGLEDPFLDYDNDDIPTIVVADENTDEDGDVVIAEYEIELDPPPPVKTAISLQVTFAVIPDPPKPRKPVHAPPRNPHGHRQYHKPKTRHYFSQYPKQYLSKPHNYHYPRHRYQQSHHYRLSQIPHHHPSQYQVYPEPKHQLEVQYYHEPVHHVAPPHPLPQEPHVTLTGELLRGYEHLGRGFS